MKKVDFYFDFASPNAYFGHKVMKSIKEKTGAEVKYIPVLLGGIFKLTNNVDQIVYAWGNTIEEPQTIRELVSKPKCFGKNFNH